MDIFVPVLLHTRARARAHAHTHTYLICSESYIRHRHVTWRPYELNMTPQSKYSINALSVMENIYSIGRKVTSFDF
jgi:hypothetical protein